MKFTKFRWRRLAAALGIGLVIELMLVYAALHISDHLSAVRGSQIAEALQAPGSYLVKWLVAIRHPGFEEQVAYIFLIPIFQWLLYSVITYFLLSLSRKRTLVATATKSQSAR